MLQGDSFNLPFKIKNKGVPFTDTDLLDVEICIGKLCKKYSTGEIFYENQKWYFPFSQEETFQFQPVAQPVQIRLVYPTEEVRGFDLGEIDVKKALSKDILVSGND